LAQVSALIGKNVLAEAGTQAVTLVEFQDLAGNPIASVQRGNVVQVEVLHDTVGPPLQATCVLVLPVNNPNIYREIKMQIRTYQGSAFGEYFNFYIPSWIQIEGRAIAIVSVQGAGVGYAVLNVTP